MPELRRFYGIIIRMFWEDHPPPHFHAAYGNNEALVDILTDQIIAGSLPLGRAQSGQTVDRIASRRVVGGLGACQNLAAAKKNRAFTVEDNVRRNHFRRHAGNRNA